MKGVRKIHSRFLGSVLSFSVMTGSVMSVMPLETAVYSEGQTIVSMDYFSANDGPVIVGSGTSDASYGFVMPVFNGGESSWEDVADDLAVNVKVGNSWKNIDEIDSFVYNSNWGHWFDGGFTGYWFSVSETTQIQLVSKSSPKVTLEYTLEFTKLDSVSITSMTATQGPVLTASVSGGSGFTYPVFNGDSDIKYEQVSHDLKVFVKREGETEWTDIDNNAESGWIYDKNFGQFRESTGGYWFNVEETTYVRLQSVSSPDVYLDYTINYSKPERTDYRLSAVGETAVNAGEKGEIGIVLPYIDGGYPVKSELDAFVYEVLADGKWIPLDNSKSGFSYKSSGYSLSDTSNQWGYWEDTIYGLWFQPITEDFTIRIGYPTDGIKGHSCGDNYVEYKLKGNPDAPRPDPIDSAPLELGTVKDFSIDGWKMIWNDEFDENSIDYSKWSHETGYYLSDDPNTWGWGNNELEYYTDSSDNSFINDGKLTLRLKNDPKSFEQDPSRIAPYSSGKLVSKDKFSFKYGRIDFCAKLPVGNGIWPALWMLPNDSVYGVWASSGEIDVMESRGRINDTVYGTIHYGGTWPSNRNSGNEYVFSDGKTYDDGFHVYSCVWEKEKIKWYADGECYSVIPYTEWYSSAAKDNPYAPFDEEFYIIMNLAAGGNFDGGISPDKSDIPCEMEVEYVRVYQSENDSDGSYTDNSVSDELNTAYLVRLQNWLLGKNVNGKGLDFDGNGAVDVFDLIKAKREITKK